MDSDHDGLRDDLERYIAETYPDEASRSAVAQLARATQASFLEAKSKEASLENAAAVARAIECIFSLHPDDVERIRAGLYTRLLNTQARQSAYRAYDRHLEGHSFPMHKLEEWTQSCDFTRGQLAH